MSRHENYDAFLIDTEWKLKAVIYNYNNKYCVALHLEMHINVQKLKDKNISIIIYWAHYHAMQHFKNTTTHENLIEFI